MNAARVMPEAGAPLIAMPARVKNTSSGYTATIGSGKTAARGSSTMDAETAIRRAAARYTGGSKLTVREVRRVERLDALGLERWEVLVERVGGES